MTGRRRILGSRMLFMLGMALMGLLAPRAGAQTDAAGIADAATTPTAPFYLKVISAETGLALPWVTVTLENGAPQPARGVSRLDLPVGVGKITVSAAAHGPLDVQIHVSEADNPIVEVELEPEKPTPEATVDEDAAVLQGSVSDAFSGEAISGATIALVGEQQEQKTTATGSFRFEVKTGRVRGTQVPAATLEIAADGYQTLRLSDIPLAPGSTARIPVRLEEKTTGSEEVVDKPQWRQPGRDHAADWVFDVTLR